MDSTSEKRKDICSRVLQTVFVSWALLMVGISDSLLGPSLLDLQDLLKTDLSKLNYIVLATGFSDFVGAILAGFLAKTADVHLRLCLSILVGTLAISMSAMVANFYYVLVLFSLQGLCRGIIYCYSIEKCSGIWRDKGVSFQLISLGPTAGGVISPLFINLFLCSRTEQQIGLEDMLHNSSGTSDAVNITYTFVPNILNYTSINETQSSQKCLPEDVRISYAYIVLGIISSPPVIGFFVYWRNSKKSATVSSSVTKNEEQSPPNRIIEIIFSVLFVIYYFPLLGGSIVYSTFLTEFGVKGPLHLEKTKMVLMTSLFWGCSLAGRIVNIILTPWLGVEKITIINFIPLLICETVLISSASQSEIILWVCTCALGIFISPYSGTGYAWCAGHVKLSPKLISASSASLGLGGMAVPFVGGLFFQNFGPMSFLYFFYANYIFAAVLFLIMLILGKKIKKHPIMEEVNINPSTQPLNDDE